MKTIYHPIFFDVYVYIQPDAIAVSGALHCCIGNKTYVHYFDHLEPITPELDPWMPQQAHTLGEALAQDMFEQFDQAILDHRKFRIVARSNHNLVIEYIETLFANLDEKLLLLLPDCDPAPELQRRAELAIRDYLLFDLSCPDGPVEQPSLI
jgi:hypothetical protein